MSITIFTHWVKGQQGRNVPITPNNSRLYKHSLRLCVSAGFFNSRFHVHTLSNLETGEGNVTLDVLVKVLSVIGYRLTVGV